MQIWQKIVWWNMRVTGFGETLPIMHLTVCRSLSSLSPPFQPNSPPPPEKINGELSQSDCGVDRGWGDWG